MIPEPSLLPPEHDPAPPRCCLCLRPGEVLLELPYGIFCRPCLAHRLLCGNAEEAAALLTASIV